MTPTLVVFLKITVTVLARATDVTEIGHLGLGTLVSVGDVPRTEDVLNMYVSLAALEVVDGETVITVVALTT